LCEPKTAQDLHSELPSVEESDGTQSEQHSVINTPCNLVVPETNSEIKEITESATLHVILTSIVHPQGEFSKRDVDTRTKERQISKDIENVNKVIEVLMKQSNVHVRDNENPLLFFPIIFQIGQYEFLVHILINLHTIYTQVTLSSY